MAARKDSGGSTASQVKQNHSEVETFLLVAFVLVQFSISLSSQHCARGPLRFRHKQHLVRVQNTSWFGFKLLTSRKNSWRCPQVCSFSTTFTCVC